MTRLLLGSMLLILSWTVRAEWTLVTDTGNASDDFVEYVDLETIGVTEA